MSDCSGFQEKFWRQKSTIRLSAINGKMKADETFAVRHPPTKRLQLFHFLFLVHRPVVWSQSGTWPPPDPLVSIF